MTAYVYVSRDSVPHLASSWGEVPNRRVLVSSRMADVDARRAMASLAERPVPGPVAFVDGSFDGEHAGWGVAWYSGGTRQASPDAELFGRCHGTAASWQIDGECAALREALAQALRQGLGVDDTLTVAYDCSTVAAFALGLWRTHSPIAAATRTAMLEAPCRVVLAHVYSHGKVSGQDPWLVAGNARADALAAKGCARPLPAL